MSPSPVGPFSQRCSLHADLSKDAVPDGYGYVVVILPRKARYVEPGGFHTHIIY